jgi:hypothetical protein
MFKSQKIAAEISKNRAKSEKEYLFCRIRKPIPFTPFPDTILSIPHW